MSGKRLSKAEQSKRMAVAIEELTQLLKDSPTIYVTLNRETTKQGRYAQSLNFYVLENGNMRILNTYIADVVKFNLDKCMGIVSTRDSGSSARTVIDWITEMPERLPSLYHKRFYLDELFRATHPR